MLYKNNVDNQRIGPVQKTWISSIITVLLWFFGTIFYIYISISYTPYVQSFFDRWINNNVLLEVFSGQMVSAMTMIGIIFGYRVIRKKPLMAGLDTAKKKDCLTAIAGSLIFIITYQIIWETTSQGSNWAIEFVTNSKGSLPFLFLTTGFLAPIFEELLFRGVLLYATISILKKLVGYLKFIQIPSETYIHYFSIFTTSVLFALVHSTQYNTITLFYMFILGLWFGHLYIKTASILVPMLAHSFVGLFTTIMLLSLY